MTGDDGKASPGRTRLIDAARAVADDPDDHNLAVLMAAVMDLPFRDMPWEFLNSPWPRAVKDSVGDQLRAVKGQGRAGS